MYTLQIAICEDLPQDMQRLAAMVEHSLEAMEVACAISRFDTGNALLQSKASSFHVVFLDMFLGDMEGIAVARALRERGDNCQIVFVTNSPDFALESYGVRAAHYLIKPISDADLHEVWRRCMVEAADPDDVVTLMIDRKPKDVCVSDILYIAADNKRCLIYTTHGVLGTRVPIDQLEYMLSRACFCRCHRSYVVNFERVAQIHEDFVMENGDTVYVRKSELIRIRERYQAYLASR